MDWDGTNKSVIPSMEFYDDPQQMIVDLINRITNLEVKIEDLQNQINKLENQVNS